MKKFALLVLLFSFTYGFSQNYPEKRLELLKELNVEIENLNLKDVNTQLKLNQIVSLDNKRKTNQTLALITTTASIICFATGGALLTAEKENIISDMFGGLLVAGGVIYGGVSIPFWVYNNKRKKEIDELIYQVNTQNTIDSLSLE